MNPTKREAVVDRRELNTDEQKILRDGERLRISVMLMDHQPSKPSAQPTVLHRPGYAPISAEQQEQRRQLQARYEAELTGRWQSGTAGQAEGLGSLNKAEAHRAYEKRLTNAWRSR
jgi:hypothetical protein